MCQVRCMNALSRTRGAEARWRESARAARRPVLWLQGLLKPYLMASKKIAGAPSTQIQVKGSLISNPAGANTDL